MSIASIAHFIGRRCHRMTNAEEKERLNGVCCLFRRASGILILTNMNLKSFKNPADTTTNTPTAK